jgi:hypothetical protein
MSKLEPTHDFLGECNNLQVSAKEFKEFFCSRCRNRECVNANWATSKWLQRVGTQEKRLLDEPLFGNPHSSKYQDLKEADFPDMMREALRLERANEDTWELPSDVQDGVGKLVQENTTNVIDDAVKVLAKAKGKKAPDLPNPREVAVQEFEAETQDLAKTAFETDTTSTEPPADVVAAETTEVEATEEPPVSQGPKYNTEVPTTGIMLEGKSHKKPVKVEEGDPWAVSDTNVVNVGATVSLSSKKDKS